MGAINLRQMKKDQSGIISAIKVGGELGLRMREMGLVPGTRITIQGRAPLYDPVALRVMGGILTLRNNEADHISVLVDPLEK
jgi:ferrous iron transport protein A